MPNVIQLLEDIKDSEQEGERKQTELLFIAETLYEADLAHKIRLHSQADIEHETSLLHLASKVLKAVVNKRESAWIHDIGSFEVDRESKELKGLAKIVFDWLAGRGLEPFVAASSDTGGQYEYTYYYVAIKVTPLLTQKVLDDYHNSLRKVDE